MNKEDYAVELMNKFMPLVKGDTPDLIVKHAKQAVLTCLSEIEAELTEFGRETDELQNMDRKFAWIESVRELLNTLNV